MRLTLASRVPCPCAAFTPRQRSRAEELGESAGHSLSMGCLILGLVAAAALVGAICLIFVYAGLHPLGHG